MVLVLREKSIAEFLSNLYLLRLSESESTVFTKQNSLFQRDLLIFGWIFFYKSYVFCLLMKNLIKNKNSWFPKKLNEIQKISQNKIVYFKIMYKFIQNHFLIRQVFILIVKNVIKYEKLYFAPYLCEIRKTYRETTMVRSK